MVSLTQELTAGPEAIAAGVFRRLATEWVGYRADVHTYLEDGDRVAAFGVYSGTYKTTGQVDAGRLRTPLPSEGRQDHARA